MSIFDIFKKKPYVFDTEDRKFSAQLREQNVELRAIERERRILEAQVELEKARADLEDLRADLSGEDEVNPSNPSDMLMSVLAAKFLGGMTNQSPSTASTSAVTDSKVELTDNQATEIISKLDKKQRVMLRALSPNAARAIAKSHFGNLSDSSLDRLEKALKTA